MGLQKSQTGRGDSTATGAKGFSFLNWVDRVGFIEEVRLEQRCERCEGFSHAGIQGKNRAGQREWPEQRP